MNRLYFSIFVEILVLAIAISLNFSQDFLAIYENSLSTKIQANLLKANLDEIIYPFQVFKKENITLLFVGDIMLSRGVANQIKINNNPRYPFLKISETINSADFAFGNLENPISLGGTNQGSIYSLRAEPEVIEGLKFAGFDGLSLANNHILDWGRIALEDTIDILEKNGIQPIGAGKNENDANSALIIELKNTKLGFLSYTNLYPESLEAKGNDSGVSSFNVVGVKQKIGELKNLNSADIIIISLHWGEEYQNYPSSEQQALAYSLIDAGADLIIGHHPHVVQAIEQYKHGWIAYSLGNFVFDQNFSQETMEGMILKVIIKNKNILRVEPIKIGISKTFQPEIIGL